MSDLHTADTRMPPGWKTYVNLALPFLIGFVVGWCVWAFWLRVIGTEPWDLHVNFYWWCLFAGGFIGALMSSHLWFLAPVGVYLGQVAYVEVIYRSSLPPGDPIVLPSLISVAIFGLLPAVVGSLVGIVVRQVRTLGNLYVRKKKPTNR